MGGGKLNNPYWATWMGDDPLKKPRSYQSIKRYMLPPKEQLYHTIEDSYEMENLAQDSGYGEVKSMRSAALDTWMNSEGDPGAKVDTAEALKAARQMQHLHGKHENK